MFHLFIILFSSVTFASVAPIPHLDLEMTGTEYSSILKNRDDGEGHDELDPVIRMGKRLLDWVKIINENRPEDQKIALTNPETQPAYPIDSPRVSSPKIILALFNQLKKEIPETIGRVVLGSSQYTEACPVEDVDFIKWGRRIDDLYGRASRWLLQEPMLWGYAARKQTDVRGFYYLNRINDLNEKLENWSKLSPDQKTQFIEWLLGLCNNSGETENHCSNLLDEAITQAGKPLSYYKKYLSAGQARWDELFLITNKRHDIDWNAPQADLVKTPFLEPESKEVLNFLKSNIEAEWRWGNWALNLDFIQGGWDTTHIEFTPGATPHVNGLAGSTITMDANQPLTEYHVQWTIRHEFGHTLGFPDCYVEFYDTKNQEMVSYQIDTSNLMCSRRGKLQKKHYEELKRVYYEQ